MALLRHHLLSLPTEQPRNYFNGWQLNLTPFVLSFWQLHWLGCLTALPADSAYTLSSRKREDVGHAPQHTYLRGSQVPLDWPPAGVRWVCSALCCWTLTDKLFLQLIECHCPVAPWSYDIYERANVLLTSFSPSRRMKVSAGSPRLCRSLRELSMEDAPGT